MAPRWRPTKATQAATPRDAPAPARQRSSRRAGPKLAWLRRLAWVLPALAAVLAGVLAGSQAGSISRWGISRLAGRSDAGSDAGWERAPANGVFPAGCKWRAVRPAGKSRAFWAVEQYEYWDEGRQAWGRAKPDACLLQSTAAPGRWRGGSPRTQVECDDTHCLYTNLWYNDGRWYVLVGDSAPAVDWWRMSHNQELHVLHVGSSRRWLQSVDWGVVEGDSLLLDYVYYTHPTAIGHWGETLFPLHSILKGERGFARPPDNFVLLHLKRAHLIEWAREVMAAALLLGKGQALPRLVFQEETPDFMTQIPQRLEGVPPRRWLCFERALVVTDPMSGGRRSFLSQADARGFRERLYRNHGLPPPAWRVPPACITFQRKAADRRVVNEPLLLQLLRQFGEVREVQFSAATPFAEQLRVVSETGVFVSAHTSNLANAAFLQPGSAVVELIQRNWAWAGMDRTFKEQTGALGDVHHWAWRARHRNQTVYLYPRDGDRFGAWPARLCESQECIEAHTNVDIVVDLQQLGALLRSRLPLAFNGTGVPDAELPWPLADEPAPAANASQS